MKTIQLRKFTFILFIALILCISGCSILKNENIQSTSNLPVKGVTEIHAIDVGQGDCTLITNENEAMLIDSGTSDCSETVLTYLKEHQIERLKYYVGSHAHTDHIGSANEIINNIPVDEVLLSPEPSDAKYYIKLLKNIKEKNIKATIPNVGNTYFVGNCKFAVLGPEPSSSVENINNSSLILKGSFGQNSFLFMGDAEEDELKNLTNSEADLRADVHKVSHHGAQNGSGNYEPLIIKSKPQIAIIECGANNDYDHPHSETIQTLEKYDIQVMRTDIKGSFVIISDGKNIWEGINE